MSSTLDTKGVLNLYPLNNQFIGSFQSEKDVVERDAFYQTIIVMDRSGSMGGMAKRIVQKIFPLTFKKLSYQPSNLIHLITFDSTSKLHAVTVNKFPGLDISAAGATLMQPAVDICRDVFRTLDSKKPVRVLTISDGEVQDQPKTAAAAAHLSSYLNGLNQRFLINSNAVRLFTSAAQPDTTAISSLLQINNGPSNSLANISATENDDSIAQKLADLFMSDNFNSLRTINSSKPIFKQFPWEDQSTTNLTMAPGENVFWMTEKPDDGFDESRFDDGKPVKAVIKPSLNADQFEDLIRSKFQDIVEKIKVLQIIGSSESKGIVEKIKQYFQNTLKLLPTGQKVIADMSIFNEIERIANDQTITGLSQQEKAEYLLKTIALPPATPKKPAELPLWSESYKFLKKLLRNLFELVENLLPPDYKQHAFFVVTAVFFVFAAWIFFM